MVKFYFIRHGETLSNIHGRIQGFSDTPLTPKGIQQAKSLKEKLDKLKFDKVYSSTSERAIDTCIYSGIKEEDIIRTRKLKEMNFGTKECFRECELDFLKPGEKVVYFDWTVFDGENIDLLTARVGEFMEDIVANNEDINVLCYAHGFTVWAAINYVDHDTFSDLVKNGINIKNCSITEIEYNGEFKINSING